MSGFGSKSGGVGAGGTSIVTPTTPTRYDSGGFDTDALIAAGARRLVDVHGLLVSSVIGPPRWFMLFDAAALPANGTIPDTAPVFLAAGSTQFSLDYEFGDPFTTGIYWACSSTEGVLTVAVVNELWVDARHIAP